MEKYSDKFLNQSYKLKNSVVGIEFEFYLKELSFYKTLELLNQDLYPVKVHGFRQYHSGFQPDSKNFKIEPDLSGGANLVELVTGPMTYYDAKFYLSKIVKFIQKHGYTNEKCSIHFNISFDNDEKNLNDLNILKLILNIDEDEIYRQYPSRKDNVYAKSVKKIIPFKEYDFFNIPISVVKNNIRIPSDKYYGINFININNNKETQRLEFRYIGGKDYEKTLGRLSFFLDKFIITTYDCIDESFNSEDISRLEEYLDKNIKNYKSLVKYDQFIVNYPKIQIQIDQNSNYDMVSTYYDKVYHKLYNIIDSSDISECIINYVTNTQMLEIVDAKFKSSSTIKGVDIINCEVEGIFSDCHFISTGIKNSRINSSRLDNSDALNSKILNCKVELGELKNCYFMNGLLNGSMISGVFRSGKLGPYASMDSEVKIVTDTDNFFDTSYDEDDKGGKIKGYKK